MQSLRFELNGQQIDEARVSPNTTLLDYLREQRHLKGTKEGCAEGDCGACTVVVIDPEAPGGASFRAVNSCLLLLPLLHGKQIFTVEALADADGTVHPAQREIVERLGSQCGYCTPGVVMSLFAATYRGDMDAPWKVDDQLCGNLCRCTGYRPIRDAANAVAGSKPDDRFTDALGDAQPIEPGLSYHAAGHRYFAPEDWPTLFEIFADHPGYRLVAGATDLGLEITKKNQRFECLVAVHGLPGLRGITADTGGWRIGAATPLSDVEAHFETRLPTFARMLRFFGSRQIKNSGTLGGNVCNASPIGDTPPVLLALDATLVVRGPGGERRIGIDAFFLGYRKTALADDELLVAIEIPKPDGNTRLSSYKVSKRREMDISAVAASFSVRVEEGVITAARMAFGGMAATPARAPSVEAALVGQPFEAASFEAAAAKIPTDFTPLSDHRGSAWYRTKVASNLVIGFFEDVRRSPQPQLADRPSHTLDSQAPSQPLSHSGGAQ